MEMLSVLLLREKWLEVTENRALDQERQFIGPEAEGWF
jgi:hypothetical protein